MKITSPALKLDKIAKQVECDYTVRLTLTWTL